MKIKVTKINANSLEELIKFIMDNSCKEANKKPSIQEFIDKDFIDKAISNIAAKLNYTFEKADTWLHDVAKVSPMAAFSIIAREIAIELDKKYEGPIENSEEIYVISSLDGRIHKIPKNNIKNYRNFAAFRTIEDAKTTCRILRKPLKKMFKGVKKEQKD